jgi:hypothetical protein
MRNDEVIKLYIQRKFGPARHACTKLAWIMLENFLKERVKQPIHKFRVPTMDQIKEMSPSDYNFHFKNDTEVQFDTHILLIVMLPAGKLSHEDLTLFLEAYGLKLTGVMDAEGSEEFMTNINALIKEFEGLIDLMKTGVNLTTVHQQRFELVFNQYLTTSLKFKSMHNDRILGRAISRLRFLCNKPEHEDRGHIRFIRAYILKDLRGGPEALAALDRELQAQQPA